MKNKFVNIRTASLLSLLMLLGILSACQPQVITETVEVTRVVTETETVIEEVEVEVEVTRIVTETETVTETVIEEVEVEADPGKLVIYSGRKESLIGPMIAQFSTATGIEVEVRYGGTAEMAATILEEGDNSPADVFYAQDPGGLGAISDAGLLMPVPDSVMGLVQPRFQGPNGDWVGISGRARVIVYNTDELSPEDLPDTIEGFTDPKWKGKIGWPPTNGSFQAMVTAMRSEWGEDRTRAWLEGIQANEPVVYAKNTPTVEAVGAGEVQVGFVNHYYLYRFIAEQGEGFAARNHFLSGGGPGSLIMVSGAGMLASGDNHANAQKFLEFMLSVPGQQYFTGQTFEYPVVVEGVKIEGAQPGLADYETTAINLPLSAMSDLVGTAELLQKLGILE